MFPGLHRLSCQICLPPPEAFVGTCHMLLVSYLHSPPCMLKQMCWMSFRACGSQIPDAFRLLVAAGLYGGAGTACAATGRLATRKSPFSLSDL